jgi:hypothetical protein
VVWCGVPRDEFLNMTPKEFKPIFDEGMNKRRLPYEIMRLQTVPLVNVHLPKNKQFKDAKKLFSFPWDDDVRKERVEDFMSKEIDWEALDRRYAKKKVDAKE